MALPIYAGARGHLQPEPGIVNAEVCSVCGVFHTADEGDPCPACKRKPPIDHPVLSAPRAD